MLHQIIKLIRVKQWIKNAFVLAPLLFSLKFLDVIADIQAMKTFFAFSFTASIIYVLNDILDRKRDASHPVKKNRPIASGKIPVKLGIIIIFFLSLLDIICLLHLAAKAALSILIYVVLNLLYSFKLKHIVLVDVFAIALGFVLRVYAGAYAIDVPVSSYIFMTTLFIALFLGFTKRRQELIHAGDSARNILKDYSVDMLNKYIIMFATLTIMSYALWTLEESTTNKFGTNRLIYSIIFVIYGLLRYVHLLDKNQDAEDPTETLLKDKGLLCVCVLYVLYIFAIFINLI